MEESKCDEYSKHDAEDLKGALLCKTCFTEKSERARMEIERARISIERSDLIRACSFSIRCRTDYF